MSNKGVTSWFTLEKLPALAVIFIALFYMGTNLSHHKWTKVEPPRGVINYDKISYYGYLPATFIYGDVTLSFLDDPNKGFANNERFWFSRLENGNKLIITSIGLAVLYTPFFLMAHWLAPVFGQSQDGFSAIYQFFILFSAWFSVMGFIILKNFLRRYFKPVVVAATLIVIALGTNLYFYATDEGPMSHSYNFFLLTSFLWVTTWWYQKQCTWRALVIGALLGYIALVRPTNILIFFVFFLWDVKSFKELGQRIIFYLKKWPYVLLMLAAFFLAWLPQLLYWKTITGHFLFFSYGEEGGAFYWLHPHIIDNLFSYRKGWFIYTPVMLFAVLGIALLRKKIPQLFLPMVVLVVLMIYVQSSWWSWYFGGGYGLRAYIDIYGLMAFPLAAVIAYAFEHSRKAVRIALPSLIALLVLFQLQQHWQYRKNIIHYVGMDKEVYWKSFMKFKRPWDYWVSLSLPDHRLAREGIYVYYDAGREPYKELETMDESKGMQFVIQMIKDDKQLYRQVLRYAKREEMTAEEAVSEVAERMYIRMLDK